MSTSSFARGSAGFVMKRSAGPVAGGSAARNAGRSLFAAKAIACPLAGASSETGVRTPRHRACWPSHDATTEAARSVAFEGLAPNANGTTTKRWS